MPFGDMEILNSVIFRNILLTFCLTFPQFILFSPFPKPLQFPPINTSGEVNPGNIEETLLNLDRVYNRYLYEERLHEERSGLRSLFRRPPRRMAPVG